MFLDKIEQLKIAYKERNIDTQLDVVEDLLFSQDKDVIFNVDCALADRTELFMKYSFLNEGDIDELRDDLETLVECFLEYGDYLETSSDDYIEDTDDEFEYEDNLLDFYKLYEKMAFGRMFVEDYVKGIDYQELDFDDLDY